jgi:hypothetical protein
MPKRIALMPPFAGEVFRVADALGAGVKPGRLRGDDLEQPFRAIRRASGVPASPFELYAPLLRAGDRFSHVTAASLWDAPLPRSAADELHVMAGAGLTRPRGRGVYGHEGAAGTSVRRRGLQCSDAATTFLELATVLELDDLVAVGDHLVLVPHLLDPIDERPYLSLTSLRDVAASATGRGVRRARLAAGLVREGAESRTETLLRLLLLRAGLPEPACGAEVLDTRGRHIGWFDLVWPELGVIVEYDGDQHRTSTSQYEKDMTRFEQASEAGLRTIRVRSHGLFVTPDATVNRIRNALAGHPDASKRR